MQSKNELINNQSMQIKQAEGEQSNQYNRSFPPPIVTSLDHLELEKGKINQQYCNFFNRDKL